MARNTRLKFETKEEKITELLGNRNITDNGCWEWRKERNEAGYGRTGHRRSRVYVHRVSYSVFKGEIGKGLLVMHSCDNPPCFNPKHLSLGTHSDNALDAYARGPSRRGEGSGGSKLKTQDVYNIRSMYEEGVSLLSVSRTFSISKSHARRIIIGSRWAHLGLTNILSNKTRKDSI